MKRYLLDTNAVGDFLNHRHGVPQRVHEARTRAIVGVHALALRVPVLTAEYHSHTHHCTSKSGISC
jgi:hypothetical protein